MTTDKLVSQKIDRRKQVSELLSSGLLLDGFAYSSRWSLIMVVGYLCLNEATVLAAAFTADLDEEELHVRLVGLRSILKSTFRKRINQGTLYGADK